MKTGKDTAQLSCLFVGNALDFSDQILGVAKAEIDYIDFVRVSSLSELLFMTLERADRIRAIIVSETAAIDLAISLPELRQKFSHATVAVAYRHAKAAREMLSETASMGPLAFLPMNLEIGRWLSILGLLVRGESYIPSELITPTLQSVEPQTPETTAGTPKEMKAKKPVRLTDREKQVLSFVAQGTQNKNIAAKLGLSEHTVKLHLHHVIAKLGVHNRTEAAIWFLEQNPGHAKHIQ